MCAGEVGIRRVAEHGGGECIRVTGRKCEAVFAFAQEVVRRADVIARDDRQARAERLVYDDAPAVVTAREDEDIGLCEERRQRLGGLEARVSHARARMG